MTGAAALADATGRLRAAGIPDPARDARRLFAHALGIPAGRLALVRHEPVVPASLARFDRAVTQRCRRQPVAQIIGHREFYGRRFKVTGDVLDPRPETEEVVAEALRIPARRILDLGTGTGCILLSLLAERPAARGTGSDLSAAALAVAAENASALGVAARVRLVRSDWCDGISGRYDLIVANPPYISEEEVPALAPDVRLWEPLAALSPGGDGLGAYRAIARGVAALAAPGARVVVEIGPTQAQDVTAILCAAGLGDIAVRRDLDGRDRVVMAVISG